MKERIPFDIKYRPEIEAGKLLVRTRDGREVRISDWDWLDGDYHIRAYIEGVGGYYTYTNKGKEHISGYINDIDLFLVANPNYKEPTTTCSTSVDWDAFRREAAKNILCAIIPLDWVAANDTKEKMCGLSIVIADELIKQLKEE